MCTLCATGRYNGFGGKLSSNETVGQAARRELHEESNLVAHHLHPAGILVQRFTDRPTAAPLVIHVFRCTEWSGEAADSDEMSVEWVEESGMPYDRMWADDRHWYPLLFRGEYFVGDWLMEGMERLVDGGVEVCSEDAVRRWTWEQHSSEEWRATVRFDKQHRAANQPSTSPTLSS